MPFISSNSFDQFCFETTELKSSLDVLLELIKKRKMDIYSLDISELTDQFMSYFESTKDKISLEQLSDYTNMLSYLLALKTRSLIPNSDLNFNSKQRDYELEQERFIRRLLEHQMYKNAIPLLEDYRSKREMLIDKFPEETDDFLPSHIPFAKLPKHLNLNKLSESFENLLLRRSIRESLSQDVNFHTETHAYNLDDVALELLSLLKQESNSIMFSELFFKVDPSKQNREYFSMFFFIILWLINQNYLYLIEDSYNNNDFQIKLNLSLLNIDSSNEDFISSIRHDLLGE